MVSSGARPILLCLLMSKTEIILLDSFLLHKELVKLVNFVEHYLKSTLTQLYLKVECSRFVIYRQHRSVHWNFRWISLFSYIPPTTLNFKMPLIAISAPLARFLNQLIHLSSQICILFQMTGAKDHPCEDKVSRTDWKEWSNGNERWWLSCNCQSHPGTL